MNNIYGWRYWCTCVNQLTNVYLSSQESSCGQNNRLCNNPFTSSCKYSICSLLRIKQVKSKMYSALLQLTQNDSHYFLVFSPTNHMQVIHTAFQNSQVRSVWNFLLHVLSIQISIYLSTLTLSKGRQEIWTYTTFCDMCIHFGPTYPHCWAFTGVQYTKQNSSLICKQVKRRLQSTYCTYYLLQIHTRTHYYGCELNNKRG